MGHCQGRKGADETAELAGFVKKNPASKLFHSETSADQTAARKLLQLLPASRKDGECGLESSQSLVANTNTADFQNFPLLLLQLLPLSCTSSCLPDRRMMYLPHWLLATLPLAFPVSGQNCYWPNGGPSELLKACPVASGNEAAACCFADHYCVTNGLCMSLSEGSWYRGGCTDSQFLKSGCPRLCHTTDIEGGGKSIRSSVDPDSAINC